MNMNSLITILILSPLTSYALSITNHIDREEPIYLELGTIKSGAENNSEACWTNIEKTIFKSDNFPFNETVNTGINDKERPAKYICIKGMWKNQGFSTNYVWDVSECKITINTIHGSKSDLTVTPECGYIKP